MIAVITVMPSLALFVVVARFWTRFSIVRNLALDDWFAGFAMVMSIGVSICMGFQVQNGMGRHIETLTLQQGIDSLKALYASILFYNLGLTFTKLSILLQYRRICVSKILMRVIHLLMGCVTLYGFWTVISAIFNCVPVAKFWDDRIPGHCINKPFLWFLNAGINIATDITLVTLPFFLLRHLMLPKRQKYTLIAILGLGGFASVVSVLRLWALYIVSVSTDITWDDPGAAIWSAVELNTGIICASLPALRALVSRYFPALFPSRSAGSAGNAKYAESRSHPHQNSFLKRVSRRSNGFGTLTDGDPEGDMKHVEESIESRTDRIPDSVRMMALHSHSVSGSIVPAMENCSHSATVVDAFSDDAGLTALPSPQTFAESPRSPGAARIASPPADGIRIMTSVRQTVEREHGRTRTDGRTW